MRFNSFTTLFAASNLLLGAAAGPVIAKRQDDSSTPAPTATASSSEASAATTSATRSVPSVGLIVETLSNGDKTTIEVAGPNATPDATTAKDEPSKTTEAFTRTGTPTSNAKLPECKGGKPFCQPDDKSTLYVGKTYFATWDTSFFPSDATIMVKILYANDTSEEVWSSEKTKNGWGSVAIPMEKGWKQDQKSFNLTIQALSFVEDSNGKAERFDGPMFTLTDEPTKHYAPPPHNKIDKEGLYIGLPVGLAFVVLIVVGLLWGMKKHRQIGIGNIMGRKKGYGQRSSRKERLGLGKKGAIRLEEQHAAPTYNRARGDSLGSLIADEDARPLPQGNHNQFRDEIQRQKTGRQY